MKKFLALLLVFLPMLSFAQSDDEIVQIIISDSIARYPSNCACPYSSMKNGRSCGGRSAYSKPGGYKPQCYREDVVQSDIDRWRSVNGVPKQTPKPTPKSVGDD